MPATETNFEREFEDIVRELRALPTSAPGHVRERVRALGEPAQAPTLLDRLRFVSWRRTLLVLAPACVLALVSAAVIHGVLNSGSTRETVATVRGESAAKSSERRDAQPQDSSRALGKATTPTLSSALPVPSPDRLQDYEASLTVRVQDLDALSDRANEAMRVVRSYGGYVVSLEQSTAPGRPGQADLVLRVPVARVEDALMRLADLGTVIDRQLSIRDLERVVQQQRARILQLKLFIAKAVERLNGSLPADVRLRLELQLGQARRELAQATKANKGTLREASLSRIALTLTTQKAVGAAKPGPGRIERAARDAASFLAAAGAVVLFLLIVLSPLIVLAVGALWGARAYRRREERRLLAST
jgi:Domain of unknown function (DUF4349)